MERFLLSVGRVSGGVGLGICMAAVGLRLSGWFWLVGFQTGTFLQMGNTLMLLACLCYASVMVRRR